MKENKRQEPKVVAGSLGAYFCHQQEGQGGYGCSIWLICLHIEHKYRKPLEMITSLPDDPPHHYVVASCDCMLELVVEPME